MAYKISGDMYELNPYVYPFTSEFYITNIEFLEP